MEEISQAEIDHIYELVSSQEKAKLEWVSSITEIPVEKIIAVAGDLGLVIDGDFIALPLQKEEVPVDSVETKYSVAKLKDKIRIEKTKRILLTILAVFMIVILIPALLFGGGFIFFSCGDAWVIATGIAIIVGGVASCIFGLGIYKKQRDF